MPAAPGRCMHALSACNARGAHAPSPHPTLPVQVQVVKGRTPRPRQSPSRCGAVCGVVVHVDVLQFIGALVNTCTLADENTHTHTCVCVCVHRIPKSTRAHWQIHTHTCARAHTHVQEFLGLVEVRFLDDMRRRTSLLQPFEGQLLLTAAEVRPQGLAEAVELLHVGSVRAGLQNQVRARARFVPAGVRLS